MAGTFAKGFETQLEEVVVDQLPTQGTYPEWLQGSLIRNGPGRFETRFSKIDHWFDGLAMLAKFTFDGKHVSYANRYLKTNVFNEAETTGRISYVGFATDPPRSMLKRLGQLLVPRMTDNANVNITQIDGHYVAMTELPLWTEFDPESLQTIGRFPFEDQISGQITTAHPRWSTLLNAEVNFMTQFVPTAKYNLFAIAHGQRKRRLIASIPTPRAAYMHSFAMTEHYAILSEFPLTLSVMAVLRGESGVNSMEWHPEHGTRFQVVRLSDGKWIGSFETEPVFSFHHINAYEERDTLVIDFPAFVNADFIKQPMQPSVLRTERPAHYSTMRYPLRRYRLSLTTGQITYDVRSTLSIELPRFNESAHAGLYYQYAYGTSENPALIDGAPSQLIKINTQTGQEWLWRCDDCYPGEPIFVAAPNAHTEDDGVILSVVLDGKRQTSFLVILNAATFEEVGRAILPHYLPFGFHGQYYPART